MLFPNLSEDELGRVLAEVNFDLDEAISTILAHDNMANAVPTEVVDDDPADEILGEEIIVQPLL